MQDDSFTTLYQVELKNRFQVLQSNVELDTDVNEQWDRIADVVKNAAESSIGYKKPVKERWLTNETKDLMRKRAMAGNIVRADHITHSVRMLRRQSRKIKISGMKTKPLSWRMHVDGMIPERCINV